LYASAIFVAGTQLLSSVTANAGTGISITGVSTSSGNTAFTVNNTGVTGLTGSTALGVSTSTGAITLTNLGVTSIVAGTGVSVDVSTGTVTISGSGVNSLTAGTDTAVTSTSGSITVYGTSTLQSVTGRGATTNAAISITNTTAATSTSTGALKVSGGVGVSGSVYAGGDIVNVASALVYDTTGVSVGNTTATLDTFSASTYRTAKYIISISNSGNAAYQSTELLLVHNGTTAYVQDASVFTGETAIMNFDASISGGNVVLTGTGTAAGNTVKVQRIYVTI
jgi:hypothetical protein